MKKITDIREIENRLFSLKGYTSNCYWMPDEILKAVQSGELYETNSEGGFGWVRQTKGRNQFYYQALKECTDSYECTFPDHMELVSEIIYAVQSSEKKEAERNILRRCGFCLSDLARMMILKHSDCQMPIKDRGNIRRAFQQDETVILSLFSSSFDRLTDAYPVGRELKDIIDRDEIWVCEDHTSGKVIGCAMSESSGKRTWIRHVTVDSGMRGKGIAKEMLQTIISTGESSTEYLLWVKQTNKVALSLYRKFGFEDTGRQMDIWTRTKN